MKVSVLDFSKYNSEIKIIIHANHSKLTFSGRKVHVIKILE